MKMSGITITTAENLLVRIEAADGTVGWGEAPSAPTMTGDTHGGLVAAVRDHLAPLLIGRDDVRTREHWSTAAARAGRQLAARIRRSRWRCSICAVMRSARR